MRPRQRDRVAAVVAHDALGLRRWCPRCRGCRAGRWPRPGRSRRARRRHRLRPSRGRGPGQRGRDLRALQDDAAVRLACAASSMRPVEHRLVLDAPGWPRCRRRPTRRPSARASSMRTASSCGGEPAEHHRVHGAEPGAREHGDHRLGDHRHVDDHAVALADARGRAARRRTAPPRRAARGRCRCGRCRSPGCRRSARPGRRGRRSTCRSSALKQVFSVAVGEPAVERRAGCRPAPIVGWRYQSIALAALAPEPSGSVEALAERFRVTAHDCPPLLIQLSVLTSWRGGRPAEPPGRSLLRTPRRGTGRRRMPPLPGRSTRRS